MSHPATTPHAGGPRGVGAAPARAAQRSWSLVAFVVFAVAAPVNMRGWLQRDLLPPGDFPGFAAEAEHFARTLERYGRLPSWDAERFAGTTPFVSPMKEAMFFPLVAGLGVASGVKLTYLVLKLLAAFGMYLLFARLLDAPAAGIVAGYAYAFGSVANCQNDPIVVSFALFPFVFLAAAEVLRAPGAWAAVAFGVLTAVEFCAHSYVQALMCPVMFLLLLGLRPWRQTSAAAGGERSLATRRALATVGAAGVFVLFAASQLAWFAADLPNHDLYPAETVEEGLRVYVESTPLPYVVRRQWLAPAGTLDPLAGGGRYLGLAACAIALGGWLAVRRRPPLRRWYQVFLLMLLTQYWLSTGPVTLCSGLAARFGWGAVTERLVERGSSVAALGLLVWGGVLFARAARSAAAPTSRAETIVGLALLSFASSHSLFALLRDASPIVAGMRSPGHFIDVAPFSACGLFGVAVVGITRAVGGRAARRWLLVAIAAVVAVDFWPSTQAYFRGTSWQALQELSPPAAGADGSLRVATRTVTYTPEADLVVSTTGLGRAWSWLYWQSGKGWHAYMDVVTAWMGPRGPGRQTGADEREVGQALSQVGRMKYVLDRQGDAPQLALGAPWVLRARRSGLALYEQPDVTPMAYGTRAWVLVVGVDAPTEAAAVAAAFARKALVVSAGERLSESSDDLVGAAARIVAGRAALDADERSRTLAIRHADRIVAADAEAALRALPEAAELVVTYERPAPEHITLRADAGREPALLFVSEAYHPWWEVTVDGERASLLRVQMAFIGVRVGPGSHVVDMRLRRPPVVAIADRVSLVAWGALVVAGLVLGVSRRWVRHGIHEATT